MIQEKILTAIQKFTNSVINDSINQADAEKSLNEIHAYFQPITEITGFESKIEFLAAVPAAKGKALGLNHAAQCLLDYNRTVKFVKAIVLAIREKQKSSPNEVISIFYAGCGPYATLLTLVAPLFQASEVQFSLLEINKNSIDSAKKLIDSLGLSDHIQDFYLADAVTFEVPNPESFQILISETLDAMLYRECYVPILFNLLPQFNKEIILIPENVIINLSLLTHSSESSIDSELDLGTVLNVREAISSNPTQANLPDKILDFSNLKMGNYSSLLLDTKVHVYDTIWLERNESSLTIPLEIKLEQPFNHQSIVFTYFLEPEVELKCRFQ